MGENEYDYTEYAPTVTESEYNEMSLHSCPECNPSEHTQLKEGLYACAFCGRLWKNHFKPRSGGEKG